MENMPFPFRQDFDKIPEKGKKDFLEKERLTDNHSRMGNKSLTILTKTRIWIIMTKRH